MFSAKEGWKKVSDIGRGAYGIISLHQHKSGRKVVMKQIFSDRDNDLNLKVVANEVELLSSLDHPNIIGYFSSFIESDILHIIMEYAPHGTMTDYLQKQNQILLSTDEVLHWFCQLLMAVSYLHSKNIVHRDIKPQNILLCGVNGCILKLSDFGISKAFSSASSASLVGTPEYMSPEVCQGLRHSYESDVWSMGCVLYNLATLQHPFQSKSLPGLINAISNRQFEKPISCPIFGDAICNIISLMLSLNPLHRPSAAVIMTHPLIAQKLYILPLLLGIQSPADKFQSFVISL